MPLLTRWNAFPTTHSLFKDFDELFKELGGHNDAARVFNPPADVIETADGFEVHLDLPGFKPEQIEVKVEDDVLTISAERVVDKREKNEKTGYLRSERNWGRYARSFVLPDTIDAAEPKANYDAGVLKVHLAKKAEVKPKTVQVKVNG
jgi:HSP20 family protein